MTDVTESIADCVWVYFSISPEEEDAELDCSLDMSDDDDNDVWPDFGNMRQEISWH